GQELSDPAHLRISRKKHRRRVNWTVMRGGSAAPGSGGNGVAGQAASLPLLKPGGTGPGEQQRESEVLNGDGGEHANNTSKGSTSDSQKPKIDESSFSSSGSSGPQGGKVPAPKENSKGNQPSEDQPTGQDAGEGEEPKELGKNPHENENNVALTATSESQSKQKEIQLPTLTTTQVNKDSSPGDTVTMQEVQQPPEYIESTSNSQTKSAAPITASQHNEPSAVHVESNPSPPTATGDAANNEADNSTEEGTPNSAPAADGAGTLERKTKRK
ncbi:mucin-associated surface protein (MASP), putative, partial [Trypanosoma cruzi marinkellei]